AAGDAVGPYGLAGDRMGVWFGGPEAVRAAGAEGGAPVPGARTAGDAAPGHSTTNTHEAGVDEPDLAKTDGRRIVTVDEGVLRVVDPARRALTGTLKLFTDDGDPLRWSAANLLLYGDRALVLAHQRYFADRAGVAGPAGRPVPDRVPQGPQLLLVDLSDAPRVVSRFRTDGDLLDARQVGGTVRVVVRSAPRLRFPYVERASDAQRLAANRRIIERAGVDAWLPRYEVTTAGRTTAGTVDCARLVRPASYSGTSMLSVLTFDLAAAGRPDGGGGGLGDGDPVTVVADGDTVYSNGSSLYIASDQRWRPVPPGRPGKPAPQVTQLYKFDIAGSGRPRYVAGGSVPGWLVAQYALSEWDGHLRVATTTGREDVANPQTSSGIHVLAQRGSGLAEVGRVTGLGKGERIYSVRFVGPRGYVVTFRQVDPLYTVDLRDPAAPRVTGELKITGYSAYLHPVGDGRLIGVGQEATAQGRTEGTQVSLFDVSDPSRPRRLAQHHVRYGHSEAEFDPHAFLYWPARRLLVLPLTVQQPEAARTVAVRAALLRVTDTGLTEVGAVDHSERAAPGRDGGIRRSLVVDGTLWTVSAAGLAATDLATLKPQAWIPT
ncbi:MAG TPA: beta-propeller domain-containing protein, partial [Pilimelia sp.]|nr:beta-propeller domain-containing protein [Pilimelia sp.]